MATRQKLAVGVSTAGQTILGPQIQIKGRIEGEEVLRIEGRVEGEIRLSETLYVEEEGVVLAEVEARDVVIAGVLVGNVHASDSVTLNPGGKLVGDIVAPRVIIADGAGFRGNVRMTGEAPSRSSRASARTTVSTPASSHRATPARSRAASGTIQRPPAPAPRRMPARSAPAPASPLDDDEITVVVRHSALRAGGEDSPKQSEASGSSKRPPTRKRKTPRARVPARGKRKAVRR